jgi:hypothetical protein
MPAPLQISITATGGPSPDPLAFANSNPPPRIQWTNNNANSITAFTLPTCVSPQTITLPILTGAITQEFQVNNGAKGSYTYSYTIASIDDDPKSGTIDVS